MMSKLWLPDFTNGTPMFSQDLDWWFLLRHPTSVSFSTFFQFFWSFVDFLHHGFVEVVPEVFYDRSFLFFIIRGSLLLFRTFFVLLKTVLFIFAWHTVQTCIGLLFQLCQIIQDVFLNSDIDYLLLFYLSKRH